MNHFYRLGILVLAVGALVLTASTVEAGGARRYAYRYSQYRPWHGTYQHTAWGQPIALVVPPTAASMTDWGWGVGNNRITTMHHQFGRRWPGPFGGGAGFQSTPPWPSDTTQFGVYPVRGPW